MTYNRIAILALAVWLGGCGGEAVVKERSATCYYWIQFTDGDCTLYPMWSHCWSVSVGDTVEVGQSAFDWVDGRYSLEIRYRPCDTTRKGE